MSAQVEIGNLSRSFSGKTALDRVSLTLEAGSTTALVGASGSGKTTLLRCLAGLLDPDAGEIRFDGRDVTRIPAERRGVGLVFQSYALFPHMTVAENLSFGMDVRRFPAEERRARVRELAEELGLTPLLARRPAQISGGERQRVALGRALSYRPVLLLLDEPLAALDPNLAASVREALVRAITREKTTVLLVTHDRADALRLGDRVALLNGGRLEQSGTPRELYRSPRSEYAANFFGAGAVWRGRASRSDECAVAETPFGAVPVPGRAPGSPVRIILRPEAIAIAPSGGVPAVARAVSYEGDHVRVAFACAGLDAEARGGADCRIRPGDPIRLALVPDLAVVLPEDSSAAEG